ncbi:MAG TPA: alpha-amylase family glycosyl hydrolase [Gemmatimonadales bacterium]|nr:alpha-amylase family glycosyl hydrolase [Gemmatimonadales bacterium]
MASRLPQNRLILGPALLALACISTSAPRERAPVVPAATTPVLAQAWNSGTVYFLLTDRFVNGDTTNDHAAGRAHGGAVLRSFEGGDLAGVTQKLDGGYFDSLGVTAIWLTPFVEQIHAGVDEGTGKTYGFHGYWTRDWTAVDPAFGTKEDLKRLIDAAHARKIRVLMDAVINHPGPVTPSDPPWPDTWVRTTPQCTYKSYVTTVDCTLVPTLPDIRTESDAPVDLPPALLEKWASEGRKDAEVASLDAWFTRTGYPRAPRFYIIKWLTDWVREYGIDGYRIDTAKHFEEGVSAELKVEASAAYEEWRMAHLAEAVDALPFYTVGEVYGWDVTQGRNYDFGDRKVDFFTFGYDGLINFGFKWQAKGSLDSLYTSYSAALHGGALSGVTFLNYASSHDDGGPLDRDRTDPMGTGTRLLLAPGTAQVYYGDELARPLVVSGADGDANLRSTMPWDRLTQPATARVLSHWRLLGRFRKNHPAVGAGEHRTLQASPLIFSRTLGTDTVLVALDQKSGVRVVPVFGLFAEGARVRDAYSGSVATVTGGKVTFAGGGSVVLLARDQ